MSWLLKIGEKIFALVLVYKRGNHTYNFIYTKVHGIAEEQKKGLVREGDCNSILFSCVPDPFVWCECVCAPRCESWPAKHCLAKGDHLGEEGNFFITSQFQLHTHTKVWLTSNQSLFVLRASRERASAQLSHYRQEIRVTCGKANPNAITIKVSFAL